MQTSLDFHWKLWRLIHLTIKQLRVMVRCRTCDKSYLYGPITVQGWGLLSRFPPFRCFPNISTSQRYMLAIEYHVRIWQVLLQLSCSDTCQIWMWFKECNRYFCEIENFAYGEIDERSFSNPHPSSLGSVCVIRAQRRIQADIQPSQSQWCHPDDRYPCAKVMALFFRTWISMS